MPQGLRSSLGTKGIQVTLCVVQSSLARVQFRPPFLAFARWAPKPVVQRQIDGVGMPSYHQRGYPSLGMSSFEDLASIVLRGMR